jgi:transcriptional regulator with XRE-family HTH domain
VRRLDYPAQLVRARSRFSGQELTRRRELLGMSKETFAEAVGRSYPSICLYERGGPPPVPVLERIAAVLGCHPGDLFVDDELAGAR